MSNDKFAQLLIKDFDNTIKRVKEIVALFRKGGVVAERVLAESGLDVLYGNGKLDEFTCTMEMLYKLDIDMINTYLEILKKEQVIREEYRPLFCVDKIHNLKQRDIPKMQIKDCFETQNAYIAHHYPGLERFIAHFREDKDFTNACTMGIQAEEDGIYGAYETRDHKICMMPMMSTRCDEFPLVNYRFNGYGNITNPGIAASEMGWSITILRESFESVTGNELQSIVIAVPSNLPTKIKNSAYTDLDKQICEELGLMDCSGRDVILKGVEVAEIAQVELIPKPVCIVSAYEHMDKSYSLKEKQWALVYDWNECEICISLVQKEHGALWISWQEIRENPLKGVRYPLLDAKRQMESSYKKSEKMMQEMLDRLQLAKSEITKVYIAGRWANYSFVSEWIEAYMGEFANCISMPEMEYVAAKGAAVLAKKRKI